MIESDQQWVLWLNQFGTSVCALSFIVFEVLKYDITTDVNFRSGINDVINDITSW